MKIIKGLITTPGDHFHERVVYTAEVTVREQHGDKEPTSPDHLQAFVLSLTPEELDYSLSEMMSDINIDYTVKRACEDAKRRYFFPTIKDDEYFSDFYEKMTAEARGDDWELQLTSDIDQGETMKIIKGILAYDIDQLLEYEAEVSNISDTPETEPRIEDLKAIILSLKPQDPEETIADLDIDLGDAINTATQDAKERYLSPGIKEDELFDDGMERLARIYHPEELEKMEECGDYQVIKGVLRRWGIVYTYTAHVGYSPAHYVDILEIRRKDTGQVLDDVVPSLTEACFDDAKERFLNFPNIKEGEFYSDYLERMNAEKETGSTKEPTVYAFASRDRVIELKAELKEAETKLQDITVELVKFLTALGVPLEVEDSQCIHGLVLRLFRGYADITIEATKDMLAFFTSETEKQDANGPLDDD